MNMGNGQALSNQVLVSRSSRARRNAGGDDKTFTTLEAVKARFSKPVFNYLLNKIFEKFRDKRNSKYYTPKGWLVGQFKRILTSNEKDTLIHDGLYDLLAYFYFRNPFDFEEKMTKAFYDFFNSHSDFKTEISNSPQIFDDYTEDDEQAIKTHFIQNKKFSSFLLNAFLGDKQIREIINSTLWNEIDKFLKSKDQSYSKGEFSRLYDWVQNKFDYLEAKKIGLNKTYDAYFKRAQTNQAVLNVPQLDFTTKFKNEITSLLSTAGTERSTLMQVVHYYLLIDMIKGRSFFSAASGNYKDAQALVDSYYASRESTSPPLDLIDKLSLFLLRLKQEITKFGFNWKTKNKAYGLVFEKDEPSEWLTPQDATKSKYDFRFSFRFSTRYVGSNPRTPDAKVFKFKIPVEVRISDLEKAQNIVEKFINQGILWNQGYMGQPLWTEKDLVDWISDFKTAADLRRFITPKAESESTFEKVISPEEWSKFSRTSLQEIDFSTINSPNFRFKIVPVLIFKVNSQDFKNGNSNAEEATPNYFGSVKVHLRLRQYPKDKQQGDLPTREVDFAIKPKSEVLTILKLVNQKISERFPNFLTFNQWQNQGNSFWLNEFINDEGNSISRLNNENVFKQRSNILLLQNFANKLLEIINREYRNDFRINSEFLVEDNDPTVRGKKIVLGLTLLDTLIGAKKYYKKALYTNKMQVFSEIKSGEFKNTKGRDVLLKEKFAKVAPLPTTVQPKPEIGTPLPDDFAFVVNQKRYTFRDILNSFREAGFKDTSVSNVKWELQPGSTEFINYVLYKYHVDYYDFATGGAKRYSGDLKIYINFDGVSPKEIEEGYQGVIRGIPEDKKNDKKLLKQIDAIFSQLKKSGKNEWREDVSLTEYKQVLNDAIDLIAKFRPNDEIIKQVEKIYNGKVPPRILNKLSDPNYLKTVKEILKYKDDFSIENLKKILENENLMKFLQNQEQSRMKDIIIETLKLTRKTKYAYFGAGVGFSVLGLLAGATSLRTMRLNSKTKIISTKFKKSRYISILSLGASILSVVASATLMLIFFIEKGGF